LQGTGIGPALRKARLGQGKSIEEASRETRIRIEYLQALERESFDTFLGDVYVRGFLRSYSSYLGLDADKVLRVYTGHFGEPKPTLPNPPPGPVRSEKVADPHWFPMRRHHSTWAFAAGVAVLVIAVLAVAGLFRSRVAPPAEPPPSIPASAVVPPTVTVGLVALRDVHVVVTTDGTVWRGTLLKGEQRSFQGESQVQVQLAQGGSAHVTVNGHSLGNPGLRGAPWVAVFKPQDFRRTPSPSTTATPTASASAH
jgi:hypothetical protein